MKSTAFALTISFFFFFFFLSFSILLLASANHARNNPEEYWKEVMKDQPMPDAIKDLLVKDGSKTTNDFVRDFDVKPNVIIYHGRDKDRMTMNKDDHHKLMNIVGDQDRMKR